MNLTIYRFNFIDMKLMLSVITGKICFLLLNVLSEFYYSRAHVTPGTTVIESQTTTSDLDNTRSAIAD